MTGFWLSSPGMAAWITSAAADQYATITMTRWKLPDDISNITMTNPFAIYYRPNVQWYATERPFNAHVYMYFDWSFYHDLYMFISVWIDPEIHVVWRLAFATQYRSLTRHNEFTWIDGVGSGRSIFYHYGLAAQSADWHEYLSGPMPRMSQLHDGKWFKRVQALMNMAECGEIAVHIEDITHLLYVELSKMINHYELNRVTHIIMSCFKDNQRQIFTITQP